MAGVGWVNAIGLFTWGLAHDDSHWRQIQKIMAQGQTLDQVLSSVLAAVYA